MFVVRILLWIWRQCFHGDEITTISSKGLAKAYFTLTSTTKEEVEILMGLKYSTIWLRNMERRREGGRG